MKEDEYTCALNVGDTVKIRGGFTRGKVVRAELHGGHVDHKIQWPDEKTTWYPRSQLVLVQRGFDEAALREKLRCPSWNEVQPGDTVHFKFRGQEYKTEAYRLNVAVVCVMGISISGVIVRTQYELLAIERPKPAPPTRPGTAIKVNGYTGLLHRRKQHLTDQTWVTDGGTFYTDAQVQDFGWEEVK